MNKKKVIYKTLLWLFPLLISFYLFLDSPNILKEIERQDKSPDYELHLRENLNIWRQNQKTQDTQNTPPLSQKELAIFFCDIDGNTATLKPFLIDISEQDDRIHYLLTQLFEKPQYLDPKYQSFIPPGTKLLSYHFDKDTQRLLINLNDNFLNPVAGDDGQKLKVAQLMHTLHSLNTITTVQIQIQGENVPFLDRDGILMNQIFSLHNIQSIIQQE